MNLIEKQFSVEKLTSDSTGSAAATAAAQEPLESSIQLIRILKDIELEMQTMHSKLNDMNEVGEQIGTQLNNSPQLSASINTKMDVLESKWNSLLEQMEYLSKVCTELQQIEIIKAKIAASSSSGGSSAKLAESSTSATAASVDSGVGGGLGSATSVGVVGSDEAGGESKKRRMQLTDEDRKNFDSSVAQLNKTLDSIKAILSTENPNKDEQFDLVRVNFLECNVKLFKTLFCD